MTSAPKPGRRSLILSTPIESRAKTIGYCLLAAVLVVAYFYVLLCYWAPANPGTDQNGYQVGGKLFAETFTTGFKPESPFSFVGWMWVRTPDGWYYPKYGLGLPVLDAIALWIGGAAHGISWVYLISPLSSAIALFGMYRLTRLVAGSFASLLAVILLACNGLLLVLANNSNSHAPALVFVVWGMYFLVRWWQQGSWWRGLLAGFLLGYAVTIRYTEGLLALPIAFAMLSSIRWRNWRTYVAALAPFVGWLVPVLALVAFNWFAMHTVTGYDSTNESTGFTWKSFAENWDFMLQQLDNGMFLLFPIGLLGLGLLYRWNWRFALLMTLWLVPGALLYTSYYWTGAFRSIAFLRFFLTLFPPVILGACWLFDQFLTGTVSNTHGRPERSAGRHQSRGAIAAPIAIGLLVALITGVSVNANLGGLERDFILDINLADAGQRITHLVPAGSTVFGDQRMLLNYLQFAGDYHCFAPESFSQRFGGRMMREGDPNQPTPLQYARREYMKKVYEKMDETALQNEQSRVTREAIQSGRRVFLIMPSTGITAGPFTARLPREFTTTTLARWKEPAEMSPKAKRAFDALGPFAMLLGRGSGVISWQVTEIKQGTGAVISTPTTRPLAPTTKSATTHRSFFRRLGA